MTQQRPARLALTAIYFGLPGPFVLFARLFAKVPFSLLCGKTGVIASAGGSSGAASELQPRFGISYTVKPTNTVVRAGYARLLDIPHYENPLFSSATGTGGLATTDVGALGLASLHGLLFPVCRG